MPLENDSAKWTIIEITSLPTEPYIPEHERAALIGLKLIIITDFKNSDDTIANKMKFFLRAANEEDRYVVLREDFIKAYKEQKGGNLQYSFIGYTEGLTHVYFSKTYCTVIKELSMIVQNPTIYTSNLDEDHPTC